MPSMKYVGLDVHKDSIAVAIAEGSTEVASTGKFGERSRHCETWCGDWGRRRRCASRMKPARVDTASIARLRTSVRTVLSQRRHSSRTGRGIG